MDTSAHPLKTLAKRRGATLASLSKMIGRNAAYLQQFVERGSPRQLSERDARAVADFLGVEPNDLTGAPAPHRHIVTIKRLDVDASAGSGATGEGELELGGYHFDRNWLRDLGASAPQHLSIIRVMGDSMEPTLSAGDDILVDQSDGAKRLRDGIYVLRRDQTLLVKRLSIHPVAGTVTIGSDNPAHPSWPDCDASSIDVVGRVIWSGRRLR